MAMRLLAPIGLTFDIRPATSGGPDVSPLAPLGVPAFRLAQDGSDYFDFHHTPDDILERVDARNLDQNVAAWAVMLWLIADRDVDFRKPAPDAPPPPAQSRPGCQAARRTPAVQAIRLEAGLK